MVEKHGQRSSSLTSGRQVVVVTGLSVDLGVQAVPVAAGGLMTLGWFGVCNFAGRDRRTLGGCEGTNEPK